MQRIYISSTYEDLKTFRTAVAEGLRQAKHFPVGMEDYTAEGSRPLAKCLKDVAECDAYVGIFAHRYGYIPKEDANPEGLSITELELRTAIRELGKDRCLVFLVDPTAPWTPGLMDATTGDNESGGKVKALRKFLETDFLFGKFKDPTNLSAIVNNAVNNLPPPMERHVRQLDFDTVLAFAEPADEADAQALADGLKKLELNTRVVARALFATSQADFQTLEQEVVRSHSAVLLITPTLLGIIKALPDQGTRAVKLLQDRTNAVICLLKGVKETDLPKDWPKPVCLEVAGTVDSICPAVQVAIESRSPTRGRSTVGLPYTVFCMSESEAKDLFEERDAGAKEQRFKDLLPGLKRSGDPVQRYGPERRAWKPFGKRNADEIALEIATGLNDPGRTLGHRFVKLQYYDFGPWLTQDASLLPIYRELRVTGCVALVDQVSLFHSGVCDAIASFLSRAGDLVAVVAVAPPPGLTADEVELIERQARERLTGIFSRFDAELDPTCEFGVVEERRTSVPTRAASGASAKTRRRRGEWARSGCSGRTAPDDRHVLFVQGRGRPLDGHGERGRYPRTSRGQRADGGLRPRGAGTRAVLPGTADLGAGARRPDQPPLVIQGIDGRRRTRGLPRRRPLHPPHLPEPRGRRQARPHAGRTARGRGPRRLRHRGPVLRLAGLLLQLGGRALLRVVA
jgi:hypothetical protein